MTEGSFHPSSLELRFPSCFAPPAEARECPGGAGLARAGNPHSGVGAGAGAERRGQGGAKLILQC